MRCKLVLLEGIADYQDEFVTWIEDRFKEFNVDDP